MPTSTNDWHRRGKGLVFVRHLGVSLPLRILPSLRSVTDRVVRSLRDIAGERHYPSPQYCIDHAPRSVLAKPIEEWRGARPRPGTRTSSLAGRRCWRCGSRAGSRNPSGSAAQRSGPCAARRAMCRSCRGASPRDPAIYGTVPLVLRCARRRRAAAPGAQQVAAACILLRTTSALRGVSCEVVMEDPRRRTLRSPASSSWPSLRPRRTNPIRSVGLRVDSEAV